MRRVAAGAGGVALIGSLFLPWFSAGGGLRAFSGWELFVTIDVLLVACALAAIAGSAPLAVAAGWIAVLTVATRAFGGGLQAGFSVALAGSLLMLARAELRGARPRTDALALAGAALVLGSLLLPWYGFQGIDQFSAWEAFELTPVAIAVAAAVAITRGRPAAAAAVIALVIYALVWMPDPVYGAWLCLAGAVVLLAGTVRANRDPVAAPA
jgi:hypothetical protein